MESESRESGKAGLVGALYITSLYISSGTDIPSQTRTQKYRRPDRPPKILGQADRQRSKSLDGHTLLESLELSDAALGTTQPNSEAHRTRAATGAVRLMVRFLTCGCAVTSSLPVAFLTRKRQFCYQTPGKSPEMRYHKCTHAPHMQPADSFVFGKEEGRGWRCFIGP